MAVGLAAAFMTLLDVSIVNVAIPSIQNGLHLGPAQLQWVLSGYALTFGLLLVPAGRYGDARGRRRVFIAGLAAFTVTSAAAGLARSSTWLVVARLVQGAAAGVVIPQVSGLVQQLFKPAERGRPFGLLGATVGVSTAVGPLLGGLLIEAFGSHEGWRWVFYINIPVGIAAMLLGRRWIPSQPGATAGDHPGTAGDHPGTAGERAGAAGGGRAGQAAGLDPVGVALLGAGVVLLLLPLVQEREWHGRAKWLLLPAAAAVLAGFAAWEWRYARRGAPLIDLSLFRHRSYALGNLIAILYFAGFTAIFFIFTLYVQRGLEFSALVAGIAITPFALGSAAAAALGGRVVVRYGRPLVATGLALVALGLAVTVLVLHFAPGRGAPLAMAAPLLVAGTGSGLVIAPNQTLTLAEVPVERAGSAAGVLQTGQRIGAAVGIAVVGSVFFAHLAAGHWSTAFRTALLVAIGFVLVGLIAAVADSIAGGRAAKRADADRRRDRRGVRTPGPAPR